MVCGSPPLTDRESMPLIVQESLSDDGTEAPRASRLMVFIEIVIAVHSTRCHQWQ
ncbi:hypothetical protein [Garicola koreensis]|uniref:Uncharacterized protein n=1 Tax=Garicola koreensis TaxID=1262554 RepID=A0A7W5U3D5_9MICC|nr:hypothetical protein [Garicola koreensis]MBB3668386.1 hypothetical protein [Garicola koreensis]